jgi:bifunctional oligoribonuclease and PAP phosphatase NrnA
MTNLNPIIKALRGHKRFLISTHVNPDADAIASALAVAMVLKSMGKTVTVVNESEVPSWLKFLPKTSLFKKTSAIKKIDYDAAVVLDCGDLARVGTVETLIDPAKPLVNIDHHKTNRGFGRLNLVLPRSSSTAEVLYGLFEKMGVRLNKDLATLLYVGIMTDTGSFRYESTSSLTHRIVSHLMSFNISSSKIYDRIYDATPVNDLKLFLEAIGRVELLKGGAVACLELDQKILNKFSGGFDVRDKIFGLLRSTKGVEVVVIFSEATPARTRVNMRSKSYFDVAHLASQFGGGGHVRASGCTMDFSIKDARKRIINSIMKGL